MHNDTHMPMPVESLTARGGNFIKVVEQLIADCILAPVSLSQLLSTVSLSRVSCGYHVHAGLTRCELRFNDSRALVAQLFVFRLTCIPRYYIWFVIEAYLNTTHLMEKGVCTCMNNNPV